MRIDWRTAPLDAWQAEAVILFAFENSDRPLPGLKRWMDGPGSWLDQLAALPDFQGKYQQLAVYYGPLDQGIQRAIYVGLGPLEHFEMGKLRSAAAVAARKCRDLHLRQPALPLLAFEGIPAEPARALEEALLGIMLGLYRYQALKTRDLEPSSFPEVLAVLAEHDPDELLQTSLTTASAVGSGISLTRDLVVAPANQVTPSFLADTARELAELYGFRLKILDFDTAREMGMGAFSAVAQGSREPASFVMIEHAPPGAELDPPLIFIGKGITFDTGGISIKPSAKMEFMKHDMAGAAAVLGTFKAIGELRVEKHVVGILPCTENMPDGKAFKPGDVLRSLSGLTIEVISTDAEGRLVLADAITYALEFKPAIMVDIATLTGACIVALGDEVAAVMGNREELTRKVQEIGSEVGDRLWPLPLWDFYFENLKSEVADFRNVGDRKGGAIVAAMFLKQFVPDEVPWVHLDIAGPAWTEKDLATASKGPTGFGVRTLIEIARRWPEL